MVNKITLVGFTGKVPEVRTLDNGQKVGRFSIATTESYKKENGDWENVTEWHDVIVWREKAEFAQQKMTSKGLLMYVEGKLTHRKYTDVNGIEKKISEVVANVVKVMRESGAESNPHHTSHTTLVKSPMFESQPSTGGDLPF
jgi:single-strand DNA-binding protein